MIFEIPNFQNFKVINNFGKDRYVNENGDIITTLDGEYHSFNDKPAMICSDGSKYWFKNGRLHRDNDLPAVIDKQESYCQKRWYVNGIFKQGRTAEYLRTEDKNERI